MAGLVLLLLAIALMGAMLGAENRKFFDNCFGLVLGVIIIGGIVMWIVRDWTYFVLPLLGFLVFLTVWDWGVGASLSGNDAKKPDVKEP
jgi:hypothetical protein